MPAINFGILMIDYQVIDVAGPMDILSSSSKELFQSVGAVVPIYAALADKAIDIKFHHINDTMDPVTLTGAMRALPTTTCDECPPLDYLLVGGPDPSGFALKERFATFVKEHVAAGKGLFTTCTGAFAIAGTGVLDGKKATVNHGLLPLCQSLYPKTEWLKEQWVSDGEIWTAGGACAGMDMMAQWVREKYGEEITKLGLASLDFTPRGLDRKLVEGY